MPLATTNATGVILPPGPCRQVVRQAGRTLYFKKDLYKLFFPTDFQKQPHARKALSGSSLYGFASSGHFHPCWAPGEGAGLAQRPKCQQSMPSARPSADQRGRDEVTSSSLNYTSGSYEVTTGGFRQVPPPRKNVWSGGTSKGWRVS